MKISCQSCQAKYTIADEKVLGKIVKIRCKKCGATIVINGNDSEATQTQVAQTGDHVFDSSGSEQWTVNVAEGDQRTLTQAEIINEYKSGVVNDETFCWKDGMNDWLPIREIEALYSACTVGPGPGLHMAHEFAPVSLGAHEDELPTHVASGQNFGLYDGGSAPESNGNGSLFGDAPAARSSNRPGANASAAAAARRTGGRGNHGADLFGNVSQAGGEDDVMTSAPERMPEAHEGPGKLTGQRNENSVLFSLNALTQTAPKEEMHGAAQADGSGLIDIKALSATMGTDNGPRSARHLDDIMNLGGGGAFSAALAAPILSPVSTHHDDYTSGGTPIRDKNKMLLYAIIGGCAFLALAMVIVALIVTSGGKKDTADTGPAAGTGSVMPAVAPPEPVARTATPTTSVPASSMATAPGTGQPAARAPSVGGGNAPAPARHAENSGGAPPAHDDAPPPAPKPPKTLLGAMNDSVPNSPGAAAPAAPAGGTAPFDRGSAAASLGGVNVGGCKKPDGPTGSGHVKVTFSPSGSVSTAEVDSPPFAGTGVGGCIAGKFRAAHIPAFSGGPVTVGKSFSLN